MSTIFAEAAYLWQLMNQEFEEHRNAAYWTAERETNGNLVNKAGKAKGVAAMALFTGRQDYAYRYASRELLDHWEKHPRPYRPRFEAQWFAGRVQVMV